VTDLSRLPGDLQIEAAIQRLGYGSPCQPKVIMAKIAKTRAEAAKAAVITPKMRRGHHGRGR